MSLLGNLITQVASSALSPDNNQNQQHNQPQSSGGMGGMLGSVLGGLSGGNAAQPQSNQGGLGGMLGSVLGGGNTNTAGAGGLGSALGSVLGARTGGGKGMLLAALMPLVLGWIQRNGGLSGALGKIKELGFDNQVNSWMSTQSTNENLNPDEVNRLFGETEIHQVAEQTGADENDVKQGISELLPEVFNQLTPNGDLGTEQEANQEIDEILQQISGALTK